MAWLGCIPTKHAVLDIVYGIILARDVVVKGLGLAATHHTPQPRKHAAFALGLATFRDHLEEHVDVHALVDVDEEGNCL